MLCSDEICWAEMPLVVMKFVGAKYGNKNVKIILVKKCPYVVMKYFGGKSCQATYPQGISLLIQMPRRIVTCSLLFRVILRRFPGPLIVLII